jgi:hypothetical protein
MENARIIKLDSPLTVYANNFDDVFGEYSNVSSKRKARIEKRQENKKAVVAARAGTKIAKKEAKATVKVAKQQGKAVAKTAKIAKKQDTKQAKVIKRQAVQQTRIAKRQDAQQGRAAKRAAATQARQQQRTTRTIARVERAALGQEPDATATENGSMQPADVSQEETEVAAEETIENAEQGQPVEQEEAPMDETETTEDSDIEAGEEEAADEGYEDEGYEDEGYEDEGYEGDGSEYEDEFASADGINYENLGDVNDIYALNSDDFYTYESGSANPDGSISPIRVKINPEVKDIAIKSAWNKEMVLQKQNQVAAINKQLANAGVNSDQAMQLGKVRAKIQSDIELHKDRAVSFDGILNEYANMDGDDSSAEGEYSEAVGRKKKTEKKRRKAEVKAAKREARKIRKKSILSRMKRKNRVTKVSRNLSPEFDSQRIVIPAAELSTGANGETGLIALDNMSDFDAPMENEFEFSNASGPMKNVNWKGVLMGVAVAGLAIWGAKKAKLF